MVPGMQGDQGEAIFDGKDEKGLLSAVGLMNCHFTEQLESSYNVGGSVN